MTTDEKSPDIQVRGQRTQNRPYEDDNSADHDNDVRPKPVEEDPTNDGPDGINNRIRSADDSELCVGDAELVAERVFQRSKGGVSPGLSDGKEDYAEEC